MATILVVDDNDTHRKRAVTLLQNEGHHTIEARDGGEGLAAACTALPDLVVFYTAHDPEREARNLTDACRVARVLTPRQTARDLLAANARLEARLQVEVQERIRAAERIEQLKRVHAMLSGISSLIVRATDRYELFREVCRLAIAPGQFRIAWCGWLDTDTQEIMPVAWAGEDVNISSIRWPKVSAAPEEETLVPAAMRLQHPVVCNDVEAEQRPILSREALLAGGLKSLIVLPLVVERQSVGCIVLVAEERGFFDEEEVRLLTELAGDVSFALVHMAKADRLMYLAYYDALTGLANRTFFQERLAQLVSAAARAQHTFAVVVADTDRFETVNETFGRHAGDELLRQLAERLVACVGQASDIGRIGPDEFAIVIFDVPELGSVVRTIDEWWRLWLDPPFKVAGQELKISAKAGIALFPNDAEDPDRLIRNAEAALKNAKSTGQTHLFFTRHLSERIAETLTLESRMRSALEREEFVLHYQPKVDLNTRQLEGVEALIRWQSPELGLVSPAKFIPLMEETGLVAEVGAWAFRRAILDRATWLERRPIAPRVAVNVSTVQLQRDDFVTTVSDALALTGAEAGLDIEVTESLIMADAVKNMAKLRQVRDLGVGITIDDFGTGYSSLGHLTRLPAETIKIDRSFVRNMLDDPDAMTLISTIISLAHTLKLVVVAEGVESEEQAKLLRLLRCDQMQGYLVSPPLSFEDMTTYLHKA